MQQALDALEMHVLGFDGVRKMELAIEALEAELAKPDETETLKKCLFQMQNAAIELAKPEQEPVAWCSLNGCGEIGYFDGKPMIMVGKVGNDCHTTPLYALEVTK